MREAILNMTLYNHNQHTRNNTTGIQDQETGNFHNQGYLYHGNRYSRSPYYSYCSKVGHVISECRNRPSKEFDKSVMSSQSKTSPTPKRRVKQETKENAKKKEKKQVEEPSAPVLAHNLNTPALEKLDPRFRPFITQGKIAMNATSNTTEVIVLGDTGAIQTLLLTHLVPQPTSTYLRQHIIIDTVAGMKKFPLYKIYLDTDLVKGEVIVAAFDEMPVACVQLLMSNDLAGDKILVITDKPNRESKEEDTSVFPVCAITRSMTRT